MLRQIAGPNGEGKSALDTKLLVDPMQVKLDGSFGDVEFARNQFVGKTLGGEKHDLALAHAQHVEVRGVLHSVHCANDTHILGGKKRNLAFPHAQHVDMR
jgi:Fe-S cluster assembly ATPase SufC